MPATTKNILPTTDLSFTSVTPGQGNTRLELDVPETVCIEAGTGKFRKASEITILHRIGYCVQSVRSPVVVGLHNVRRRPGIVFLYV